MYFTFQSPYYLLFLLVIPLIILVYVFSLRKKKGRAIRFANIKAIERIKGVSLVSRNIVLFSISILLALCLVLALSGFTVHVTMEASSFSYVLAIDSSNSMNANDLSPSRMEVAKDAATNFVDSLSTGTEVGLISFSGTPKIEERLTEDKAAIKYSIGEISTRNIGGTNILDTIITSSNLLRDENAKSVILISDGQANVESTERIINYANEKDIVVHTVGIGTVRGGEVSENFTSQLDEDVLEALAYNTEGRYYQVKNREDLLSAFEEIMTFTEAKVSIELERYLLIVSIILLLVDWILYNTKFEVIP